MVIVLSAALSLVLTGAFIQLATRRGWGKSVRSDGPSSHLGKTGTPTMGGIAVLVATLVMAVIYGGLGTTQVALLLVLIASATLGFLDDLASLRRKALRAMRLADPDSTTDEATGMLARYRIFGHIVIAAGFAIWAVNAGFAASGIGWLDIVLYTFAMVGSINAFNFTDGLDGLAGGVSAIVLLFFLGGLVAVGAPLAAALLGALLGFLWYNAHPARVFMGGVGAEAIGAVVAALAIVQGHVFLLPLIAIIPVLEVLSVIVQVSYFRATGGKRLLRMSPLHHHFELVGLSETKITARFWLVTAVAVALAMAIAGINPLGS
jgi:phospho-N-acetylmuramoyl-pentapeptide-transferase